MKPLVIYHDNCADGFGAAFAAWLKLGDEAEYVPMSYGEDWTIDPRGREVYILDFSFKRDTMDFIFEFAGQVVWLDHHKTAFEMWCGEISEGGSWCEDTNFMQGQHMITLDNNRSGAYLAWEYFHPGTEVPMFIKHIDDHDRWQFKLPGTKQFNKALWSYAPWTFRQWAHWSDSNKYPEFIVDKYREGEAILRAHDQNVQAMVKSAARKCKILTKVQYGSHIDSIEYGEFDGLAANCPSHLTSDVGHELAIQSGTFGLCWALGKDGTVANCSLRSNGDYDVSAIAKSFGGGGHRNAAGFEVDIQVLLRWLK